MQSITHRLRRWLIGWTDGVRRWPTLVLIGFLAAAGALLAYAVTHLSINTDTTDMIAPELGFRQDWRALDRAFPQYNDTLVVVVEGETAGAAERVATGLAEAMRARDDLFGDVFYPQGDAFFRRNGLLYLDVEALNGLADELAEAQPFIGGLNADPSLRGLFGLLAQAIEYRDQAPLPTDQFAAVMTRIADVIVAAREGRPAALDWDALIGAPDLGPDQRIQIIVTKPVVDYASLQPAAQAIATIRSLAADLSADLDETVRVRLTGEAALEDEEFQNISIGMGIAGIVSFVLVITLLMLCFHSVRLAAAVLITLVIGLLLTLGFAAIAVGQLNVISVAFAILFIGLGVDFGIHYGLRYREGRAIGHAHRSAVLRAAKRVGGPLAICAIAAAIGFYAFLPTDYVGLSELGLIAGTGMIIALFCNLTLLPAMLTLMTPSGRLRPKPDASVGDRAQHFAFRHARMILAVSGVLAVGALAMLPRVSFDFDPLSLKDPGAESVATLLDLMNSVDESFYAISAVAENLEQAKQWAAEVSTLPTVSGTRTLADFVPENQDDKFPIIDTLALVLGPALSETHRPAPSDAERQAAAERLRTALDGVGGGNTPLDTAAGRLRAALTALTEAEPGAIDWPSLEQRLIGGLPARLESLDQSLAAEPVDSADLPADLSERWLTADGRARVEIYPEGDVRGDLPALRRFVRSVQTVIPSASGETVVIVETGRTIVRAFLEAGAIAVVGILALLALLLRNLRDVALVFTPLLFAGLMTVAATVLLAIPFNLANVIVLPLLFGLGVASSVQLVMRERREGSSAEMMDSSTPRAVVFSALTTIGSFGSLAISGHVGISSMGILLTLAIVFTLLSALFLLPALMARVGRGARARG